MSWSIILASRNGEDTLPLTLGALAKVEPPECGLEIILVDNASTDRTGGILREFAEAHRALCLEELRRGKSFALNTAIGRATGEMLVFIDDDVLPVTGWLRAFEAAIQEFPDAAVFAGRVRPHWLVPPPQWLEYLASIGRACGCTDPRAQAGPYPAVHVKGANFAIRRAALSGHRFDTSDVNFGAGSGAVGGEDTRFVRGLETNGIVHVPDAIVGHIIDAGEMTPRSVFRRFMRIGRGSAAMSGHGRLAFVRPAAAVAAFSVIALVMLGFRRKKSAALSMARLATNMGRLDYHLRGPRP